MNPPGRIKKLDEAVVNRIAAGEIIQRPANALKELIENSLDAKSTNIQIVAKEGGMKLLQIQDNGTGIRKDDMEIVCERFTTSKLQKFDDLKSIATFGFRGEALASISHVALLTITTKTVDEKCAFKATYIDSKLKAPPKPCAGNQGTTIMIENLFYNVATRRKALSNATEEFNKITEVVMKYSVHNPSVGFTLKKHGQTAPQVRTPHNSSKMNNVRIIYGNSVARELLEVEYEDTMYRFKTHCLVTNPNYTSKRITILLFINNRLVESSSFRKMLEDLYSIYLPSKTHPWCYISLEIDPNNIDVNVHPTKHEVKFLHEDTIIDRVRSALDEKLAGNSASRTFYLQARLPKADITAPVLKEILPDYDKSNSEKSRKVQPCELNRMDAADQKLDKFNFTIHTSQKLDESNVDVCENKSLNDITVLNDSELSKPSTSMIEDCNTVVKNIFAGRDNTNSDNSDNLEKIHEGARNIERNTEKITEKNIQTLVKQTTSWSDIVDSSPSVSNDKERVGNGIKNVQPSKKEISDTKDYVNDLLKTVNEGLDVDWEENSIEEKCVDTIADNARKRVYQYLGYSSQENIEQPEEIEKSDKLQKSVEKDNADSQGKNITSSFKSYSVNNFRREVKLTSVLRLRKDIEDNYDEGVRQILANLVFVGCIDQRSALIQSGVNLYICNTKRLTEELFYEIMLYDFANHGVIKFSDPLALQELALLGLETEEAGWTEEDGQKDDLAESVKELLLEKADMMKEYFSIVIDKKGYLKSLPILLDKYFPREGGLPLYILRLATEVDWTTEQACFKNVCRETAMYYSEVSSMHGVHDWKYITEHVLYPAIKESLLPPKHFTHDSTLLQIASLPDLYKVFERC